MDPKQQLIIKFNHLILIQGFTQFSMVELAKRADISRAKLYIYFKNKDEIVAAVVARHLEFTTKHAVPTVATTSNLLPTMLNTWLMIGSTTPRFEAELKQKYPQLFRQFTRAYADYFKQLTAFYQDGQRQKLITEQVSADALLFQNKVTVRGTLQAVASGEVSLAQGEQYLRAGFTLLLRATLLNHDYQTDAAFQKLLQNIVTEYYETFAHLNNKVK